MKKFIRYGFLIYFWIVAAGSMASGDIVVGLVGVFLVMISVAYPDFERKGRVKMYWAMIFLGLLLTLALLHYRGITS